MGPRRVREADRETIQYTDDSGSHAHDIVTDSLMIGRGGIAYPVDIRIASSPDVSREHARIRRDPKTGVFYLIDLSSFGTTLNGRHVPGATRESTARRSARTGRKRSCQTSPGSASPDMVFLEFRKVLP